MIKGLMISLISKSSRQLLPVAPLLIAAATQVCRSKSAATGAQPPMSVEEGLETCCAGQRCVAIAGYMMLGSYFGERFFGAS